MVEETEKKEIENVDELAEFRPSKEELEETMIEEAEKEEKEIGRLAKRANLKEKEKETGITLLEKEEVEEEAGKKEKKEKPPKIRIAGTIRDRRFPPLEESAGYCTEHGKDVAHRFNKETGSYEQYVENTKIKRKEAVRFRG